MMIKDLQLEIEKLKEWIESKKKELENPEETFKKKYIGEFPERGK